MTRQKYKAIDLLRSKLQRIYINDDDKVDGILNQLSKTSPISSLRINAARNHREILKSLQSQKLKLIPSKIYKHSFTTTIPIKKLKNTKEFTNGDILLQNQSSLIPALCIFDEKDIRMKQGKVQVLDMCASPGGKTQLMAEILNGMAGVLFEILACELDATRFKKLEHLMNKTSSSNVVCKLVDSSRIRFQEDPSVKSKFGINHQFDYILCDAPCSGEGTMNWNDHVSYKNYNEKFIAQKSNIQSKLIHNAFINLLKPGGILVYSTCTLNDEENEGVLAKLEEKVGRQMELLDLPNIFRSFPGYNGKMLRVTPDCDYQGFFVAKIKKHF